MSLVLFLVVGLTYRHLINLQYHHLLKIDQPLQVSQNLYPVILINFFVLLRLLPSVFLHPFSVVPLVRSYLFLVLDPL